MMSISEAIFENMYRKYYLELSQYSKRLRDDPITSQEITNLFYHPQSKVHFIMDYKGTGFCGFYLIGFDENTNPGTDYYLQEFYVLPQYRNMGYGREAFKSILETYKGDICMFILKENTGAINFWNKMLSEFNCRDKTADVVCAMPSDDCIFKVFCVK